MAADAGKCAGILRGWKVRPDGKSDVYVKRREPIPAFLQPALYVAFCSVPLTSRAP